MAELQNGQHSLDQAKKFKDLANEAYNNRDYRTALLNYHHCILNAKIVTQMTSKGLDQLAQIVFGVGEHTKEPEIVESKTLTEETSDNPPCCSENGNSTENTKEISPGEKLQIEANDLIAKCYNNLAACIINGPPRQKDDYLRAVFYCDSALKIVGENEKAFFRKGSAFMKAEKYEKAIECFDKCQNNAQAKKLSDECRVKESDDRRKRDDEIRANFAKVRAAEAQMDNGPMMNGSIH